MSIKWKFWKDTGKTFFRVKLPFVIDAETLELAVIRRSFMGLKTKADVIKAVKDEINESGSPVFWSVSDHLTDEDLEKERESARLLTKKFFPEAYKNGNKVTEK